MAYLEEGWTQLARGQWQGAEEAFGRAVAELGTAEAYEGLSWAAWWLDDADEVFEARRRAYRLYLDAGEPAAAARMAVWLAADEADFRGANAVAQGWLQRAHRLLDPLEPGADHGWLAFHEGFLSGDPERMGSAGARAAELGRRTGVADLEMLGLALQGAAMVTRAEVREGMRLLDEATAVAMEGRAVIPISSAWSFCFLVSACTSVMDYDRALQWCDRIADFAERYSSRFMLGFCSAEYGDINLWRGRWRQAEQALTSSIAHFAESRPAWVDGPTAGLAELRRRQGRTAEAEELMGDLYSPGAQLCRARLALDRGEVERCLDLVQRVLRQVPEQQLTGLMPILELLIDARLVEGNVEEAQRILARIRRAAEQIDTDPAQAVYRRAAGRTALAAGEPAEARRDLEDAVDGFERSGAAYEGARTRIDLAQCLAALHRTEESVREAQVARNVLTGMGAEPEASRAGKLIQAGRSYQSKAGLLTARERQVLDLVARGRTNRAIAEELVVSEHTVHRHVTNILRKLDLPTRAAAAAWAARSEDGNRR